MQTMIICAGRLKSNAENQSKLLKWMRTSVTANPRPDRQHYRTPLRTVTAYSEAPFAHTREATDPRWRSGNPHSLPLNPVLLLFPTIPVFVDVGLHCDIAQYGRRGALSCH